MLHLSCSSLELTVNEEGAVTALLHRSTGQRLLAGDCHTVPVWEVGLMRPVVWDDPLPPLEIPARAYEGHEWWTNRCEYSAERVINSAGAAPRIESGPEQLTCTWEHPLDDGMATVVLRWSVVGEALHVNCEVALPAGWAIRWVAAPRIRGFGSVDAAADDALLMPVNFGVLRSNPLEAMTDFRGQYPSGGQWGQFIGWLHGRSALYVGVQDPDSNHTGLAMQYVEGDAPAPHYTDRWDMERDDAPWQLRERQSLAVRLADGLRPAMQLSVRHWPTMGQRWQASYPVVLRAIEGEWQDVGALHREWAIGQRWCRRGKLHQRPTMAFSDLDLWVTRYGFHPASLEPKPAWEFRDAMLKLREYFGCPFGVHWYHWHAFSWHTAYPRHAPVVEGFAEVVRELQSHDIVVMPYCQGRLLYRDRPAIETERSHACIEMNGQPYLEMYTPGDDWPLALCSHTDWTRQQWHEAARLLWRQYGVEGVYYDQISAMPPSLCYHAGHGHAPGGGNSTWRGYDGALARLEEMKREDPRRFVASESLCDAFIDRLDLLLAFVPPLEEYVPLWQSVYSGYTTTMGRLTPDAVMQDQQLFVICQGEQLLFGGQLGWMDERILSYPEAAAFLRKAARLRSQLRKWLHDGELLSPYPCKISGRMLTRLLPAKLTTADHDILLQRPAVRQSHWLAPDGTKLVLLLNETTTVASVDGLPSNAMIRRLGAQGREEASDARIELPGFSVAAISYR